MWPIFRKKRESRDPTHLEPLAPYGFSVVDIETTGLYPNRHDRIIELAVVRLTPSGTVIDEFVTLINPGRDIGPTRIHGIETSDVLKAPHFSEIAGDIADRLAGNAIVAHNARFDVEFIHTEFEGITPHIPPLPSICTMHLAQILGVAVSSYRLGALCQHYDVPLDAPHSALADAKATASLFNRLLRSSNDPRGTGGLMYLGFDEMPAPAEAWPLLPRGGLLLQREAARSQKAPTYLARLITRLESAPFGGPPAAHSYIDLLDRVLEDRVVTEDEGTGLLETAQRWGLSQAQVLEIHQSYVEALVHAALDDGTVSNAERRDLHRVGRLIGMSLDAVDDMLASPRAPAHDARDQQRSLSGLSVCFTGDSVCRLNGEPMSRLLAEELATQGGLVVKSSVTKKLDLLVVADPHTLSGKAQKARRYGTRIMAEEIFWRTIGVDVE